jgi:hypothetical protein
VLSGWTLTSGESNDKTGLIAEHRGVKPALVTRAPPQGFARLAQEIEIPAGKKTTLKLKVACNPEGAGVFDVRIGGTTLLRKQLVGKETSGEWQEFTVDLSPYAGNRVWILLRQSDPQSPHPELYWAAAEVTRE